MQVNFNHPDHVREVLALGAHGSPIAPHPRRYTRAMFTDGLCLAMGVKLPNPSAGADALANRTLKDITEYWRDVYTPVYANYRVLLRTLWGRKPYPGLGHIVLAYGMGDFNAVTTDALNRSLKVIGESMPATSDRWTNEIPSDRMDVTRFNTEPAMGLDTVAPGMQIPSPTDISQGKSQWSIKKHAEIIKISREAWISDDLEVLRQPGRRYGGTGNATKDDLVYGVLVSNPTMSDGVAMFHANHSNLVTGTGASISVSKLDEACSALAAQQTAEGKPMRLRGRYLIVPVALQNAAAEVIRNISTPENRFELVVEPRLDDTSETQWYLAADKVQIDSIVCAYVNGLREPQIELKEKFDSDEIAWRYRFELGVKAVDHRSMVRVN